MARARAKYTDKMGRERTPTRAAWGLIRQLPSGRYQASYTGPDGNRHVAPATFTAKIDADEWLATQRARIVAGEWAPATVKAAHKKQAERAQRFGDYAREWIETRTGRNGEPLRPSTRAEYGRLLGGPLRPLTSKPLAAFTPDAVRSWYSALVRTGRKTTAARAYGLLTAVLKTAVTDGLLNANPCQIRGAMNASTGKKITPPTAAELVIIEANMPERLRCAVAVAAWGALRYGELTELRRRDVRFEDGTALLNIERAVTHGRGGEFHVGPPKSAAGVRTVAMPPRVSEQIADHLERFAEPGPDGLLFPSPRGGHLAQSTFVRAWYPARQAAGREDLPWHALRHYGGTRYALTGATLKELQDRLGHSTIAAAMRYQHSAGRDAELAARMAELD